MEDPVEFDPMELVPVQAVTPPPKTLEFAMQAEKSLNVAWAKYRKRLGSAANEDLGVMSTRDLAEQILNGVSIDAEVDAQVTADLHDSFDAAFGEWGALAKEKTDLVSNLDGEGGDNTNNFVEEKTEDTFLDIVQVSESKIKQSNETHEQTGSSQSGWSDDPFSDLDRL